MRYEIKNIDTSLLDIKVVEKPLHISPVSKRRQGGGYIPFDPENEEMMFEFRNEAATALRSFCRRYELSIIDAGLDVENIKKIALTLEIDKFKEAI